MSVSHSVKSVRKRRRPLKQVIVAASLVAVAVGTVSWAVIELASGPTPSARELLFHHAIPAIMIGIIIAVVLSILLNRFVVEPVQVVFCHLYRIGSGRLEPLELDTGVEEIQTMVDGVNLLVRRLESASGNTNFSQAQNRLKKIRTELRSMADGAGEDSPLFLDVVREIRALEGDLLSMGGGRS